jgi:hypothetical protein
MSKLPFCNRSLNTGYATVCRTASLLLSWAVSSVHFLDAVLLCVPTVLSATENSSSPFCFVNVSSIFEVLFMCCDTNDNRLLQGDNYFCVFVGLCVPPFMSVSVRITFSVVLYTPKKWFRTWRRNTSHSWFKARYWDIFIYKNLWAQIIFIFYFV